MDFINSILFFMREILESFINMKGEGRDEHA
ncbi:hypothetical protein G3A_11525 [Bacillus sp. 17376]|nr:hypothetical protein G3A_11525 [Bacillus sp. 17376]